MAVFSYAYLIAPMVFFLPAFVILRRWKLIYARVLFFTVFAGLLAFVLYDSWEYFHLFTKKSSAFYNIMINESAILISWTVLYFSSFILRRYLDKKGKG